jgi:hypothetical protein
VDGFVSDRRHCVDQPLGFFLFLALHVKADENSTPHGGM